MHFNGFVYATKRLNAHPGPSTGTTITAIPRIPHIPRNPLEFQQRCGNKQELQPGIIPSRRSQRASRLLPVPSGAAGLEMRIGEQGMPKEETEQERDGGAGNAQKWDGGAGNGKGGMGEQGRNGRGRTRTENSGKAREKDGGRAGKQRQHGGTGKKCHSSMGRALRREGDTKPSGQPQPPRPARQHPLFPPLPAFQEAHYPTPPEGRGSPALPSAVPRSSPSIRPSHAQPGHGSRPSRPPLLTQPRRGGRRPPLPSAPLPARPAARGAQSGG